MKILSYLLILLVCGSISCSPKQESSNSSTPDPSIKQQLSSFLTDYFALNQALINDNLDNAKQAAATFAETTKKLDVSKLSGEQLDLYHLHSSNLKMALGNLGASADIEAARGELATISEAMYALVKAFHPNESTLYYQYCPMARNNKGATWISEKKELENPYMGQMMLTCGKTQETID
jgi:membrane fusion protein, copper/silver efflux system